MKFSLNYKSKNKDLAEEIRIPINQLGLMFSYIKENTNKRYNIIVNKSIEISKIIEQIEYIKNIVDYTIEIDNISILQSLSKDYNCYLKFPISDFATINYLINYKVSDLLIDSPITMSLPELHTIPNLPKIRVSPTFSPNAILSQDENSNTFFIRPEDLHLYENLIDIVDFKQEDKEDTLFSIYKRGTYNYDLSLLIPNLHIKVPNLFIDDSFAEARLNCGQRCVWPTSPHCRKCHTELKLANTLARYFKKEGNKDSEGI